MKRLLLLAALSLASPFQIYADENCTDSCPFNGCSSLPNTTIKVGAGYRQDYLKWAYSGFSPGTSIREKWDDLSIGYIEACIRTEKLIYPDNIQDAFVICKVFFEKESKQLLDSL